VPISSADCGMTLPALAVQCSHGDDRAFPRMDVPRNDCLERENDVSLHDQRIDADVRRCPVRPLSFNVNAKAICGGAYRSADGSELTDRRPGSVCIA
jgi:hypothetical protein